jgi:hypothetical protein
VRRWSLRELCHLLDLGGEFDEALVLDAAARGAGDDVELLEEVRRDGAEPAVRDVVQYLAADLDLAAFLLERHRQRHPQRVADASREELLERDARLDDAVGRHPGLGHTEVQRHVRAGLREACVRVDHEPRVRVLDRHDVVAEAELVEVSAMVDRARDDGGDVVVRETLVVLRRDRAGIHADPQGDPVAPRDVDEPRDLLDRRLLALVVVQVAWVVADLLDERRDELGEAVVLLQVDRQRDPRERRELRQRLDVLARIDGDPDQVRARVLQELDLAPRGGEVLGACRRHALDGDGAVTPELEGPDADDARATGGRHGPEILGLPAAAGQSTGRNPHMDFRDLRPVPIRRCGGRSAKHDGGVRPRTTPPDERGRSPLFRSPPARPGPRPGCGLGLSPHLHTGQALRL